jgi:kynurenine formamidase
VALIDLTHPFRHGMYKQNIFPPIKVERCIRIEERRLNVTCAEFAVHSGTHVDAFCHFVADGTPMDRIPLESFAGRAVGWRFERQGGEAITAADLEAAQPAAEAGDVVFFGTGWSSYFDGDPDRYRVHPYLSDDAAAWLVERRIKLAVFDVPTPDQPEVGRPEGFDWPIHHALLEGGVLIAENAAGLERVAGRSFKAYAFPIPFVEGDGSPVRLVAEL